jgi:hypothetical protein
VNAKKTRGGDSVLPFMHGRPCMYKKANICRQAHKQQLTTGVPVKSLKPIIDDWDNSLLFLSVSGQ